ncbi:MAG TPA: TonB-dependent receptor [Longimicrobiales bacterium]|nr:TonB-dependent receptor [Longimicrobiales bacterium]
MGSVRARTWTGGAVAALFAAGASPAALAGQVPAGSLDTLTVRVPSRVSPGLSARTRTLAVLTREEIEAVPARSVGDLLRWMNGLELQQRSGAQADVSLRGAGFEQVLVLVDGVRVSDAQSGHFDLDLAVPVDRIERIEVLRGPASALFGGDAVGGVVHVVTRPGSRTRVPGSGVAVPGGPSVGGRVEGGSFGTLRLSSTQTVPVGGVRLDLGQEWAESDGDRPGTDYRNVVVHGALDAPLAGGALGVTGGWADRAFGAADFYAPIPAWEETRTTRLAADWTSGARGGWRLEARLSAREHDDLFVFFRDDPESGRNEHEGRQLGAEVVARTVGEGSRFSFAGGLEGWTDDLESSNLGSRSESRGAVFGEGVARVGEAGVVTLGLRADGHEAYGGFVSPSLAASWDAAPGIRLRSSVARSFRPPTWTERYYVDPFHRASADLDAERAWAWEAGVDWIPSAAWSLRLTGFVRRSEDLIDWAKPDGSDEEVVWVTRNVEEADFTGVELDLGGAGPGGLRWSVGASLLDLDATGESGFFSKRALRPETRRVAVTLSRGLGEWVGLTLHGLYGRRIEEDGYHRVDLRIQAGLPVGALYLDLVNLTDQGHLDASGQPVPGFGVYVGYRIDG